MTEPTYDLETEAGIANDDLAEATHRIDELEAEIDDLMSAPHEPSPVEVRASALSIAASLCQFGMEPKEVLAHARKFAAFILGEEQPGEVVPIK